MYKPHRADKYVTQYKNGVISRGVAVENIAETLYVASMGIPSAVWSKYMSRRIRALRARIREETGLMDDVIEFIRKSERNKRR
jgi:hypothetical protein